MMDQDALQALSLGFQAFMVGLLAALGLIATLAHRHLKDPLLKLGGLYLLVAAGSAFTFSGATEMLLPNMQYNWLDPVSLVFGAATMGIWSRLSYSLLKDSPGVRRLLPLIRGLVIAAFVLAGVALLPFTPLHRLAEALLGVLTPTLAVISMLAAVRARQDGIMTALALFVGALALLVCCAALWATGLGWIGDNLAMVVLHAALGAQGFIVGGTILNRMGRLRREADEAQAAHLANAEWKAAEFEGLLVVRNAQLNARLKDLEEYRRTAEAANEALRRALQQLEEASGTDTLTGAWNRRRFEEAALAQMSLTHRNHEPVSLLVMDLDHFKRINDTYGHSAGDEVLVGMARIVRQSLRASDVLVRWGGEEFVVLAPGTAQAGALGLAEKLRLALAAEAFPRIGQVTMSIGVAQYTMGEDLKGWVDRADQALYAAKDAGRNQTVEAPVPTPWAGADGRVRTLLEEGWSPKYECGHALMDSQHERLHLMATALLTLSGERASAADVRLRLETLVAHAAQHFHDEEALMRELGYGGLASHSSQHQDLLQTARRLVDQATSGHMELAPLVDFLVQDLVQGHIYEDDQDYFGLLRERAQAG